MSGIYRKRAVARVASLAIVTVTTLIAYALDPFSGGV